MTLFRWRQRSLTAAMQTTVEIADRQALLTTLQTDPRLHDIIDDDIEVKFYGYDRRNGWRTHTVTILNIGLVGFTDGPL